MIPRPVFVLVTGEPHKVDYGIPRFTTHPFSVVTVAWCYPVVESWVIAVRFDDSFQVRAEALQEIAEEAGVAKDGKRWLRED